MDEDDDAVALWRSKTRITLGWSASAWEGLGRTLALFDDTQGAAACFSLAVALRPSEGQAAYESLAALSTWSREATAAFARSVCDVSPTALWAWRALAVLSCSEEAVKALQSALRCDPEDASSWLALGLAYERLAKLPAARRALSRAVELAPESEEAGLALCGLLDSQAAEEAAAVAHQRQPTALWAARLLAESARCRGAPEEALPALRSLLRSAPKDAATWEVLAAAYARSRKPKAAYAAAVQALSCEHATSDLPLAYAASLSVLLTLGSLPPHGMLELRAGVSADTTPPLRIVRSSRASLHSSSSVAGLPRPALPLRLRIRAAGAAARRQACGKSAAGDGSLQSARRRRRTSGLQGTRRLPPRQRLLSGASQAARRPARFFCCAALATQLEQLVGRFCAVCLTHARAFACGAPCRRGGAVCASPFLQCRCLERARSRRAPWSCAACGRRL